jgi:hypothetical protein
VEHDGGRPGGRQPVSSRAPSWGPCPSFTKRQDLMRTLIPRYLAAISLSRLDDDGLHQIAGAVKQASPTSALVAANPAMAASVAAMEKKDAAFTKSGETVTETRNKLKVDIAADAQCRSDLEGEIRTYVTFASNDAKSPADVHAAGLPPAPPRPPKNQPPAVPDQIDAKAPKRGHGKITVSVHETGPTRHEYVAQWSPDPVGPSSWAALGVGHGKTRSVTGASGTKVWVRFAMVRGQLQSDWSTPILVTLP